MTKNWYDSDNPSTVVRGGSWRIAIWVVAVIVFCLLISGGLWALGVFTSDIKGQGDSIKQKNSVTNRVGAQQRFEDLYADIKASDAKLAPAKAALDADPKNSLKQTQITGLTNYCIDVTNQYNAEARKYLSRDFRAIDLPSQIDSQDPSTDCKP